MSIRSFLAMAVEALNPVVIKELRHGLQSRAFIFVFLLMQGFLALSMFATISAASLRRSGNVDDILGFWFIVALPISVLIPLRGFGAIFNESKGRTLDMLLLTRLTATRIIWGKWLSIVLQALLAAIVVLPYLMLRYFAGGVDIMADLMAVCVLLMTGGLIAAAAVALSAIPLPIIRLLISVGAGIMIFGGLESIGPAFFMSGRSGLDAESLLAIGGVLALAIPLILSWGAGRIAHPAENHAAPTRLLALALIALLWLYQVSNVSQPAILFAYLAWLFTGATAMSEPARRRMQPGRFTKRLGLTGRLAGWFLDTGWCQGFLFLLAVGLPLSFALYNKLGSGGPVILLYALPCMVLMPRLLIEWIGVRPERQGGAYALVFFLLFVTGILPGAILPLFDVPGNQVYILSILPSYAFLQSFTDPSSMGLHLVVSQFTLLGVSIALLLRLPRAFVESGRGWKTRQDGVPAP